MYKQLVNYESESEYVYESDYSVSESDRDSFSDIGSVRDSLSDTRSARESDIEFENNSQIKNITDNEKNFMKMLNYPNLISPKYLVLDANSSIDGYLMEYLENYEPLGDSRNIPNILCFYKILLYICYEFLNIIECGFRPCTEHGDNVMILYNSQKTDILRVVLIDLDDIEKCSSHTDKDTVNQLNIIMLLNLSRRIESQAQDIIYVDNGDCKIKDEFDTINKLIDAINRIIPNLQ